MEEGKTDAIKGELKKIIFGNETSGYIVAAFQIGRKEIIAIGNILRPECGCEYTLRGRWIEHDRYGKQYQFFNYNLETPQDERGIFRYLVRIAKWVGPSTANRIIDTYGENTLEVLRTRKPETIAAKIKGVTTQRAVAIQTCLLKKEHIEAALVELEGLLAVPGLRRDVPMELVTEYGSDAPQKVKDNPYILTKIKRIGFAIADSVAIGNIGFDPNSVFRKQAASEHVLDETMRASGSIWIRRSVVESSMLDLLTGTTEVASGVDRLIQRGYAVSDGEYVAFSSKAENEALIAHTVCLMIGGANDN